MANNYSEKLKDPRWQRKRLEVLQRDNFTCSCCGDDKSTLHVHHVKYNGEPWEVDSSLLVTFCELCHFAHEFYKDVIIRKVIKKSFPKNDVLVIFCDDGVIISTIEHKNQVSDHICLGQEMIETIFHESKKFPING